MKLCKRTFLLALTILALALGPGACSDSASKSDDGGTDDGNTQDGGDTGDDGGIPSPLLDTEFGEQGILRARSSWSTDAIYAAERTGDGKFILAGTTINYGHAAQILLVRFTSDGQADATFGNGGIKLIPAYDQSRVTGLAPLPDGSTILSGSAYFNDSIEFLAKVNPQGDLDPGFGQGGMVSWDGHFHGNTAPMKVPGEP
jgi:uncharacterized delta-60 repeat protein